MRIKKPGMVSKGTGERLDQLRAERGYPPRHRPQAKIKLEHHSPVGYFMGPDYCSTHLSKAAKELRAHYNAPINGIADTLGITDDHVIGIEMGEYSFATTADFELYFAAIKLNAREG